MFMQDSSVQGFNNPAESWEGAPEPSFVTTISSSGALVHLAGDSEMRNLLSSFLTKKKTLGFDRVL